MSEFTRNILITDGIWKMMNSGPLFLGETPVSPVSGHVGGGFSDFENEKFYQITRVRGMPDFLMSMVSDSDHWLFISSNGSLTAGRRDRDHALFPYYTEDRIHDCRGITGSRTILRVTREGRTFLWEPFSGEHERIYPVTRNLYKSIYGNKVIFEEVNPQLGVTFRYGWYNSDRFGFIRRSWMINHGSIPLEIKVLDGVRNILPSGTDAVFQNEFSNLLDAYKKNELVEGTSLGLYMLSSIPVDRAEPSEALTATTVWSIGTGEGDAILLSDKQVDRFLEGAEVSTEHDIRASRGAYYIQSQMELEPGGSREWMMVGDVDLDSTGVANLRSYLSTAEDPRADLLSDIASGTTALIGMVAGADGLQVTGLSLYCARHFSNTLYNIMRGGVFINNYVLDGSDLGLYVRQCNREVAARHREWIDRLSGETGLTDLLRMAGEKGDADLERICREYLPLTFSRRHGDPSRPWNRFSILTRNADGTRRLHYEGNWRDIFQNWEALAFSFPRFIEGMILRFLNASTPDGYNPYRITREGVDWEVPDPADPWAYIGYWGDHQVIYLQKLLEQSEAFHPGTLEGLLARDIFVYANVPYRIRSFRDLVRDPKNTIDFDHALHAEMMRLTDRIGADGRLLRNSRGEIQHASLAEKILVTLLAKMSNFIPGAGIWLNTQRPEWNDANNALVGNGASMVTLCYLRRFLVFWEGIFGEMAAGEVVIAGEIAEHLEGILTCLERYSGSPESGFSGELQASFLKEAGMAGERYREKIYSQGFSGTRVTVGKERLAGFCELAIRYVDRSIMANRRPDGLYHAYNLVRMEGDRVEVRHLYEMLEGQVAVISSGVLDSAGVLEVLDSLRSSAMYRADQDSYLLYPDRQLPRFIEKNIIPAGKVQGSELLGLLAERNDRSVIAADAEGHFHFNGAFRNATMLSEALDRLDASVYGELVEKERGPVMELFEELFDHQSFTGRSGTFYGYEGLGSIYWHMVSKLLLAAGECYFRARREGASPEILDRLRQHFHRIKKGIGVEKSPDRYGAFPTDAYSHTPAGSGAKQPGLTGQVKEDFLSRMGELGIRVSRGMIHFDQSLMDPGEPLRKEEVFSYPDPSGRPGQIPLAPGELACTFCQVPVVFRSGEQEEVVVSFSDGRRERIPGNSIPPEMCRGIFLRTGEVARMEFFSRTINR